VRFEAALVRLRYALPRAAVRRLFARIDARAKGFIEHADLAALLRTTQVRCPRPRPAAENPSLSCFTPH
jgi:hypothetical protein